MENVGIFMTIWNILRPFGTFYGNLVQFVLIWYIFFRFGMFGPRKIWQPFPKQHRRIERHFNFWARSNQLSIQPQRLINRTEDNIENYLHVPMKEMVKLWRIHSLVFT
jgi:hypothetical protein